MYDNIKVLTLTAHLRFVILEKKKYLYNSDLQKNGIRSRVHTSALFLRHFVVLRIFFFLLNLKEV